jgi:hypothetical protein
LAGEILKFESKNAQWIAAHALRELTAPKINTWVSKIGNRNHHQNNLQKQTCKPG